MHDKMIMKTPETGVSFAARQPLWDGIDDSTRISNFTPLLVRRFFRSRGKAG
jgi:hypothetical protein